MKSSSPSSLVEYVLPAHIAFSRELAPYTKHNISDSTGQALTLAQLCEYSNRDITQTRLQYAPIKGDIKLRAEIIKFHQGLNSHQQNLNANHAITFSGAQEALSAIYQSVLRPGDEVVVVTPSYPSLVIMAKSLGAKVREIKLQPNKAWQVNIEDFTSVINSKTRLIVLNSPHNPTGSVIDSTLAEQILQLAKKYQCYLLSDDVSQASHYGSINIAHRYLDYQNSIVVGVMSKSFGLAGIRIGWAVTPNKALLENVMAIKSRNSICCSVTDEHLALIALENKEPILAENNRVIVENIALFTTFVSQFSEHLSWCPPQGGILALVEVKNIHSITDWSTALAKNTGILALPSKLFGLSGNYFRLGLGQKNFRQILSKFGEYLSADRA